MSKASEIRNLNNEYKKPPLGCMPATLHAEQRAKDLADAISRNILDDNFYYCKYWAEELMIQIEIAEKFQPIRIIGLEKGGSDE